MDKPVVSVSNASPSEGSNVTFTCNVNTTDGAISYKWFLNTIEITNETAMDYTISNGKRVHNGNYTCEANTSNSPAMTSVSKSIHFLCKFTDISFKKHYFVNLVIFNIEKNLN